MNHIFAQKGIAIPLVIVVILCLGMIVLSLSFMSNTNVRIESRTTTSEQLMNMSEYLCYELIEKVKTTTDPIGVKLSGTKNNIKYLCFVDRKNTDPITGTDTIADFDAYIMCSRKDVKTILAVRIKYLNIMKRCIMYFDAAPNQAVSESDPDFAKAREIFIDYKEI